MQLARYLIMMKSKLLFLCAGLLLISAGVAFAADPAVKAKAKTKAQAKEIDKLPVIELVLVKGGCFQMGDVFGGGDSDEVPVHEVCVKDFNIGKYEVTQELWQKVMGQNPAEYKECGMNCPMDSVSWDMALEFINKLNVMTKKKYRLPTEAEWEYAARSGGKQEKWPGTNSEGSLGEYAWFGDNSSETTHPIGLKKPNGLGLYDMAGNVREWCQDWYNEEFYAKGPKDNPESKEAFKKIGIEPPKRAQRGGGAHDGSALNRTVARRNNAPADVYSTWGLRLVLPVK